MQAAWVVLVKVKPTRWEGHGLRPWIEAAKKRLHHNVLAIALANKLARIAWRHGRTITLLIYHVGLATAATLYRKLPYDTKSAFAAIGLVTEAPMTIIGRSDLPADSLKDLVGYLKGAGAKTTLANAGIGSASHLCGMLLMSQLQVTLTTVPYRGTGPVMNDLLGKQVDMTCDQATNTTGRS